MFIDTHCHLNFKAFDPDLDEVIARAKTKGVEKIIIPGAKLDSSIKAVEIAQSHENCFAAVGIHPHHADEYLTIGSDTIKNELIRLAKHEKVVAIGEIGLDYYVYKNYPPITEELKKQQKELLKLQIDIATELNLPVVIHCREAQYDLLKILKNIFNDKLTGVFHCFDGDEAYLKQVLDLGFFVGFDGNSTYEENGHLRRAINSTPPDRLLLETDSPYLTPIPYRRTRNEPSYIVHTAQTVAECTQKTIQEIASQTSKNATDLFQV